MFMDILNDWRKLLLLKEERYSLSDIFALSPKDSKELQVSERLRAPLFMRMDEKRWCKQVFRKEGEAFAPASPSPRSPEIENKGQNKN